jgi:hypothetical protein
MVTILISIASLCAISYLGYRVWFLAGALADSQEYIEMLESTNAYMYERIEKSYTAMTQIDRLGAFESEDEAGTTFDLLKEVVTELKEEFDGEETRKEK